MKNIDKLLDETIERFDNQFEFMDGNEALSLVIDKLKRKEFKNIIKYPYEAMNKVLKGIFPTSFIVIGADSGNGKSEILGDIAIDACKQGKKVLYFDFENDDGDFTERQICKEYSRRTKTDFKVADLNMLDIDADDSITDMIYDCGVRVAEETKNMRIFKNNHLPNINDFISKLEMVRDVDLICIDHLHYFSFDDDGKAAVQISKIMRELRRLTKIEKIPVILISHLTKRDRKKLPTYSDFHGSSNIGKEAKTCILLHRDQDGSLMIIDKNREGGTLTQLPYVHYPHGLDFSEKHDSGFSKTF
jgi:replicative DNA helicase